MIASEHRDVDRRSPCGAPGGSRPAPARASGGARRSASSRWRIAAASSGSAWSWPSTWRTPCTTSSASSSSSVPACSGAWLGGHGRADDDVAEQHRHAVPVIDSIRCRAGTTARRSGRRARGARRSARRSRRRSTNVSVSSPARPSLVQHGAGQTRPAVDVDRRPRPARRHRPRRPPRHPWRGWDSEVRSRAPRRRRRTWLLGWRVGALVGGDDVGDDAVAHDVGTP